MKLPSIPVVEKPSELINLVANSKLYKERMVKLMEYQEHINSQLSHVDEVENLASYKNKLQARERAIAESEHKTKEYVKSQKADADKYVEKSTASADAERAGLKGVKRDLDQRESALSKAETACKYRESELVSKTLELSKLRNTTEAREVEAEEAFHKYEDKLAAINALAKE